MNRTCPACGQENRIPLARLADAAKCGRCKASLGPLAEPLDVDAATFDAIVGSARVPVLVDFWAAWCGPCRMAAPQVKEAARQLAGQALVLKVDTDRERSLAQRFRIQGIPHFMVFHGGEIAVSQSGLVSSGQMASWVRDARRGERARTL